MTVVVSTDMDDSRPVESAHVHTARVFRFALEALEAASKLRLRDGRSLRLRMGIHTGSCVSGIVGRDMPRYCFFGATVNRAHRLESTSMPGKIHVSGECARLLLHSDEFCLSQRDDVVKLKGFKRDEATYWLDHGYGLGSNSHGYGRDRDRGSEKRTKSEDSLSTADMSPPTSPENTPNNSFYSKDAVRE